MLTKSLAFCEIPGKICEICTEECANGVKIYKIRFAKNEKSTILRPKIVFGEVQNGHFGGQIWMFDTFQKCGDECGVRE